VGFISEAIQGPTLAAMITKSGGEVFSDN